MEQLLLFWHKSSIQVAVSQFVLLYPIEQSQLYEPFKFRHVEECKHGALTVHSSMSSSQKVPKKIAWFIFVILKLTLWIQAIHFGVFGNLNSYAYSTEKTFFRNSEALAPEFLEHCKETFTKWLHYKLSQPQRGLMLQHFSEKYVFSCKKITFWTKKLFKKLLIYIIQTG